jgi:hypothetical protein
MPKIIQHIEQDYDWAELKAAASEGTLLRIGDEIELALKSGTTHRVVLADRTPDGQFVFVFKDCVAERPMYENTAPPVSWEMSDMRRWLNTEFLTDLPDDLAAIIEPRHIAQTVKGKEHVTEDKIWLPSMTEVCGPREWANGDDPEETRFPIFSTERERVKDFEGETAAVWLRSVDAGNTSYFCFVLASGTAANNRAGFSLAVAPGFYI